MNVQVVGLSIAAPLVPVADTLAVYCVLAANAAVGVNVAVCVLAL